MLNYLPEAAIPAGI